MKSWWRWVIRRRRARRTTIASVGGSRRIVATGLRGSARVPLARSVALLRCAPDTRGDMPSGCDRYRGGNGQRVAAAVPSVPSGRPQPRQTAPRDGAITTNVPRHKKRTCACIPARNALNETSHGFNQIRFLAKLKWDAQRVFLGNAPQAM